MEKLIIGALGGLFLGAVVVEIVRRKYPVLPPLAAEGPQELTAPVDERESADAASETDADDETSTPENQEP